MDLSAIDQALQGVLEAMETKWDSTALPPPKQLQKGALVLVHDTPAVGVYLDTAEIEEKLGGLKNWAGFVLVDVVLRGYEPPELEELLTKYALMICQCVEQDPTLGGRVKWATPRGILGMFAPRPGGVFERGMRVRIQILPTEVS